MKQNTAPIAPENVLMDNYQVYGSTFESLKEEIDRIAASTHFVPAMSGDIEILSFANRDVRNGAPCVISYQLKPHHLPSKYPNLSQNHFLCSIRETKAGTPELLKEWTEQSKIAFILNHNNGAIDKPSRTLYLASTVALQTMNRFGIAGERLGTPTFYRDASCVEGFEKDLKVTLAVRKVGKVQKVFSILSDKYTPIDQNVFFKIVKAIEEDSDLGVAKCHQWLVNNFYTQLFIEFPEKAEELSQLYGLSRAMIPGIMIVTSDTGDSSLKIRGTWRISGSNSVIVNSEVKRRHSGNVELKEVLKEVTEQVFAEYAKLPEALCNLMLHDITHPEWDLNTSEGWSSNAEEIENVIKNAFQKLGIVKAAGKKTEKKLRDALLNMFDGSVHYTAYDVAMAIMQLPEKVQFVNGTKRDILQLQKACGKAPFIDYSAKSIIIDEE